jgi:hypothetical protein
MRQRGYTLAGTVMAVACMALLAVALFYGSGAFGGRASTREDGRGKTVPGAVKAAAQDEVCRSNLNQVRAGLQMALTTEEEPPVDLSALRLGESFTRCPLGGEPYAYDAATAQVRCPHPGHEAY